MAERDKRKHENPWNVGPMVRFHLAHQNGMDRSKKYVKELDINGFKATVEFGKENVIPKQYVSLLQNAQSAVHPTPRVHQIDQARGGEGRPASELMNSQQQAQYVSDYDVVILQEG